MFSMNQPSHLKLSSPRLNGSARRSKNFGTRIVASGSRQAARPLLRYSAKTILNRPIREMR